MHSRLLSSCIQKPVCVQLIVKKGNGPELGARDFQLSRLMGITKRRRSLSFDAINTTLCSSDSLI